MMSPVEPREVPMEGWLEKQGAKGIRKGWKRRWFCCKENKLFYYKSKEDMKPTGFIDLHKCSLIVPVGFAIQGKEGCFGFQINTPDRHYSLLADSLQQRDFWVSNLNSYVIELRENPGTRSLPLSDESESELIAESSSFFEQSASYIQRGSYDELSMGLKDTPGFEMLPGERIIWKRQDVKSYEFDSQGEMIAELGIALITNYKFVFIPNVMVDEKDIISVPLLQIYKVSRVGDLDSKPAPTDARGRMISTAASVVTSSKQLLSESKQKIIQTKNSIVGKMSSDAEEEGLASSDKPEKDQTFRKKRSVEIFCHYIRTVRLSFSQLTPRADEEFVENLKVVFPASLKGVFAFTYKKMIGEVADTEDGWKIYSLKEEYKRIGAPSAGWRFTDLNRDYRLCKTYPQELIVPNEITDEVLREVFQFRKMGRIPALTWKHPKNYACIIRSSQPQVGLSNERCEEDELLCAKALLATVGSDTLYLMDARPKVNAMANQAKGSGYENMQVYRNTKIKFLNIENIHVVRESQRKLHALCQPGTRSEHNHWLSSLAATHWVDHIRLILKGAVRIAQLVETNNTVLVHCSDGWDRTAQLSGLAQLLLDPFFRTIRGFEILIEKEWLHFGHKFEDRNGHFYGQNDKEQSPIFMQFLEGVYQVHNQFPQEFEFNTEFLMEIADHVHSGLYGTFLCNSYSERQASNVHTETVSLWTHINKNKDMWKNRFWAANSKTTVLFPSISGPNIKFWDEYYFRWSKYVHRDLTLEHNKEFYDNYIGMKTAMQYLISTNQPVSQQQLKELYYQYLHNPLPSFKQANQRSPKLSLVEHTPTSRKNRKDDTKGAQGNWRENILIEGYLHKKGANRRNWTVRWFVCTTNELMYFKRPGESRPKGLIPLNGCIVATSLRKEHSFSVQTSDRTYYFVAYGASDKEKWMSTIKEVSKGTIPSPSMSQSSYVPPRPASPRHKTLTQIQDKIGASTSNLLSKMKSSSNLNAEE